MQLQSRIRKNDDADDYLEGYLENPLANLRKAWNTHSGNPRPAGDDINQLYNTGESVSSVYNFAICIKTLYTDTTFGDPPGSFPPTLKQLDEDPMKHFKFFILATENGSKGGKNAQGRSDVAAKAWVKTAVEDVKRCRKACKHIWDTALATFTSAKATTVIAGLPYGAGPALLNQIENQQERQTTMALFTLFDQLISLKLGAKESFASLFSRALGIRARLNNWKPPIKLPDQLIIVCLMRQLPRQFHGTRTIIMTTPSLTLRSCRDMLLDAENRDAERVKQELGTASTTTEREMQSEGTGLVGDGEPRKLKKKKKKRKPAEKSAKYHSEGPCSVHGSRCSHASSECYVLHPELKPKKKGEGAVAEAEVAESGDVSGPYGFMNEDLGYCLMMVGDEKEDDTEEEDVDGECYATPVVTSRSRKVYAVAIGHQTGIFLDYESACAAYKGYPGAKFKGFKSMDKAKQYLRDNQPPTATYSRKKITRKKPRNFGWTLKGTKATRRASKEFASKNSVEGEVIHLKRSKSSTDEAERDRNVSEIKHLARIGGMKNLTRPTVIDLSGDSMNQDAKPQDELESSVYKDVAGAESSYEDMRERAVSSLTEVLELHRTGDLRVRSRRSFAPGLTTTMIHPNTVPRTTVSERSESSEEGVTFEISLSMTTLRRLQPGAKVKLKVCGIESNTGEALIGTRSSEAKGKQEPYEFMKECDAVDIREEQPDKTVKRSKQYRYYAAIGWGVYNKWLHVSGLDPSRYKGFDDRETAETWLQEREREENKDVSEARARGAKTNYQEASSKQVKRTNRYKFYAAIGWGVYDRRIQVSALDPSRYKGFDDRHAAEAWLEIQENKEKKEINAARARAADGNTNANPSNNYPEHSDESDDDEPGMSHSESDKQDNTANKTRRSSGNALVNSNEKNKRDTALDSGATEHCAKHVPGELEAATVGSMSGLNGSRTAVKGMAQVNKVRNVMCMPGISRNLLSVGRLLDQEGGQLVFTSKTAHLVTRTRHVLIATRDKSGLYIVCNESYQLESKIGEALAGTSVSLEVAKQRVIALHKAFGHASIGTLKTIIKNHNFDGVTTDHLKLLPPCVACLLGKAHKTPKERQAKEKATRFAERICADCTGPFRTRSVGGSLYALVAVCEFSAWTWVYPVANLKQVWKHLTTLIEVNLHQRDDRSVKYFRSDGGSEFINAKVNELLAKHGIVRETTCANTSYQNGKAERRIRTLFDRVRTVLSDASSYISRGFWADAVVYAAYTLNRTTTTIDKSPFELRYGRKPKISHLRPFGNPCVVYRKRTVAGKVQDAGVKGTFLGYGYISGKRGYRVRIDGTNSVTTSRDVSFCAFDSRVEEVQILPEDTLRTPDAVITEPANASEIDARLNLPLGTGTDDHTPEDDASEECATITSPANAREAERAISQNHTYRAGAKVEANWRGHGSFYPAVVTVVHTAGTNGSRNTYDLVYECDGEIERNVSKVNVRPRTGSANVSTEKPCGHALVTDCNPAYLADVPDLARAHVTPKHYGEASRGPDRSKWTKSMKEELESLRKQGVYAFVNELPTGEIALRCLWVYKVKCGANGEVTRYKSRLTVNGKSQRYGIDYKKTFSPVAFATSIRLLFALGIANKFKFRQYDIKCAFLYADLPKEQRVYMHAPPGSGRKGYWLLKKSLYGLRQAPMLFNGHLDTTLREMGFTSCTFDPCLYIHRESGAYLVVVVDDMVLASPTMDFSAKFYNNLSKKYDVKDLGEPSYVIGVRVNITPHSIKFTQDRYISDLFALHKPGDTPTSTPATPNAILCALGLHKQDESPLLSDPSVYRSLVGGLMYALITRPDVAAAVSICARYVQAPRQAHLEAAKRILRFLYHTREQPLVYTLCDDIAIRAFVDSSWGNDIDTRRSRFGYAIYVGKCLVAWCSKLHPALAMSSAEAEYTAATEAVKAIKWIVSLMTFLRIDLQTPVAVYEDNDACRLMSTSSQVSGRNKHFELRQHFVRNQVTAGLVTLLPVRTKYQIADIFTKPTVRPVFEKHAIALLQGLPDSYLTKATVEGGS